MKVSFVIPAYNEQKIIGKCLKSVFAEIARAHKAGVKVDTEVVVVNNASSDKTREEALKFPDITVIEEKLKGLVYARRAGFVATSGELVANIDADTMLPEGWLTTVVREFEKNKNLVALSGPYIYYDIHPLQRAVVKIWYFPGWLFDKLMQPILGHATMLQGGNFVIRRDAWERAGGFDTSISFYGEDADVARRISKYGKVLWTWRFPMYTSGRRMLQEGFIRTGLNYGLGLFSTHITGRPVNAAYTDVRPE